MGALDADGVFAGLTVGCELLFFVQDAVVLHWGFSLR